MFSLLISLLILLIIGGVLYWAVGQLSAAFGLPALLVTVIQVGIVLILLILAINLLLPAIPHLRLG